MAEPVVLYRTLTCRQCGMDWTRPRKKGAQPVLCPDCKANPIPKPRRAVRRLDTNAAGYRLAAAVTTYRLAIEEATGALRLGRSPRHETPASAPITA